MSLKEKMKKLESGKGIEFMGEREKGEVSELFDKEVTIIDFGIITDKKTKDEYAVFIVNEIKDTFYCGNSIITEWLKDLDEEDIAELKSNGAKFKIESRTAKDSGRKYTAYVPLID